MLTFKKFHISSHHPLRARKEPRHRNTLREDITRLAKTMTAAEIAEATGESVGTIHGQLLRMGIKPPKPKK